MTTEEKCENCRYWREMDAEEELGNCCRYPPKVVDGGSSTTMLYLVGHFPEVYGFDFCGEFKEKKV